MRTTQQSKSRLWTQLGEISTKTQRSRFFHWQLWIRYCSNIRWEKIPERKLWKSEKCYLKLPFNRDVKVSWLRSTVQKHQHLLKQIAAAEVGISWRINQNLLKRNYRLAWTRWVVGGTANFFAVMSSRNGVGLAWFWISATSYQIRAFFCSVSAWRVNRRKLALIWAEKVLFRG